MSVPSRYVQKCAPWSMTPFRNASPWTRLPMSRPCMSVIATTIVSIRPSRTQLSSSARRSCLPAAPWPALAWLASLMAVLLRTPDTVDVGAAPNGDGPRAVSPRLSGAGQLAGCLLELLLDLGELLGRALCNRAAEARPGPRVVVDHQQHDERAHDEPRRRVECEGVEEDRAEEHDPDDGQPGERAAPPAQAPRLALAPRLVAAHAQPDADAVRPVEEHGAHRRDSADEEKRVATKCLREHVDDEDEQPARGADRNDRVARRPPAVAHLLEPAAAREAVIAAEREEHSAGRGDRREATERHRERDAGGQQATERIEAGTKVLLEDVLHAAAAAAVGEHVRGR